jgi:hypothetical protein
MGAVAAVVAAVFLLGVSYWLGNACLRKLGHKTLAETLAEMPRRARRHLWLSMLVGLAIASVVGWAFSSHHGAIGVAVLVALFILPEFVLVPLRIRRSRRAAETSRARRTLASGDTRGGPH